MLIDRRSVTMNVPRFRTAEQAIEFAFGYAPVCKISKAIVSMRGGSVRLRAERRDPYDDAAEAALILRIVERELSVDDLCFVVCRYRWDSAEAKMVSVLRVLELTRAKFPRVPWMFLRETVGCWSHMERSHTELWWADFLGIAPSTVQRWRRGFKARGRRMPGILTWLDDRVREACDQAAAELRETGWIR